jgi:redox-sensitive bicupin YhaK (pirin superfamily)
MKKIKRIINAQPSQDGDGVKIFRSIGSHQLIDTDPFLLLDELKSDDANDYMGGFPSHPHRGFETVTYMLEGQMRHKDSAGNEGVIRAGDIQWMTAGRGIIHSEMPEQDAGRMWGFQLWINLPASEKMRAPRYQEIASATIPEVSLNSAAASAGKVRVLAGEYINDEGSITKGAVGDIITNPLMLDIKLPRDEELTLNLPPKHNIVIYVYKGAIEIDGALIKSQQLAQLEVAENTSDDISDDKKSSLLIKHHEAVKDSDAGFLLIGAEPINEPIVRAGPFVMNTKQELQQAYDDFRAGRLA